MDNNRRFARYAGALLHALLDFGAIPSGRRWYRLNLVGCFFGGRRACVLGVLHEFNATD